MSGEVHSASIVDDSRMASALDRARKASREALRIAVLMVHFNEARASSKSVGSTTSDDVRPSPASAYTCREMIPRRRIASSTIAASSSGERPSVRKWTSASSGASYGASTPVKFFSIPDLALA
jgi:hypothetical protein